MRYAVDLRHSLQALAVAMVRVEWARKDIYSVVEAVEMWESRRDFQRVWEGWEAGIHGFPYFPYSVISMACFRSAMLDNCYATRRNVPNPPRNTCRDRLSLRALTI
jgi:hypothetical protein